MKPMGEFPSLVEFVKGFWEFLKELGEEIANEFLKQAIATTIASAMATPTPDLTADEGVQNAFQQGYQQISPVENILTSPIGITQGQGSLVEFQLQVAKWETWQDVNRLG